MTSFVYFSGIFRDKYLAVQLLSVLLNRVFRNKYEVASVVNAGIKTFTEAKDVSCSRA